MLHELGILYSFGTLGIPLCWREGHAGCAVHCSECVLYFFGYSLSDRSHDYGFDDVSVTNGPGILRGCTCFTVDWRLQWQVLVQYGDTPKHTDSVSKNIPHIASVQLCKPVDCTFFTGEGCKPAAEDNYVVHAQGLVDVHSLLEAMENHIGSYICREEVTPVNMTISTELHEGP
ncbi:hypothetical protein K469DRAFT_202484 [Zopfia rhizophila CBS 207.26]|uniref:Uncharacterized protein n=1 Tax=Zopfia rhizophila CBS 207.26 TaxID=1314779 RepID=A0A6A6DW14_9PEZI|nr:hypothetical protein K469DRAFT_202484 [Zopfia rhizophila CBS 207.26]